MSSERNGAGAASAAEPGGPNGDLAAADLVVVGAGAIGLSCAWRAASAGIETLVIDAGRAERASEVAAGMIAPIGEASWGEEALLVAALASAAAWPTFASELERAAGVEVPYRRCGALHVGLDRDESAELRRLHALHGELGLESDWRRASECRRLEPGLATAVTGGFEAPGEAEVDPRALLVALRAATRAAGGRIEEATVSELLIEGDAGGEGDGRAGARDCDIEEASGVATGGGARAIVGVGLEGGGRAACRRLLLASGARLGSELLPAPVRPPVRPVKGEILRLRARAGERPCERIVVTERVYVVPRSGEEVVVGATVEERGFDLRVSAGGVHELLREAYRVLPEIAELELVESAAGLRPATPDNAPVIGASGIGGLLLAGGHYRNGILLAPITAEAIVAELTAAPPPAAIEALRPTRFVREPQEAGA